MNASDTTPEHDSFLTTSPVFPLLCGLEFLPRPIRLSREGQRDYDQLLDLAKQHNWEFDRQRLQLFIQNPAHALIVTDHHRAIQYVNRGFIRMTGYARSEAINQYPSFLQGAGTSPDTRAAIRACLAAERPFSGNIVNYRKNGEHYWCRVSIEPISNQKKQVVHYIAFEREVDRPDETFP